MTGSKRIEPDWVKQRASELGFSLVGITTPEPPPHHVTYQAWIDSGHHAQMNYLAHPDAIEKRRDPRKILPECQSIIVTGTCYDASMTGTNADFQVAGYALGEDYHAILRERLHELVSALEQRSGRSIKHRIYTDTGPLLERELAQRAGLGWIGKNTCLIHPALGSYFLLAELMLDLALEPDQPFLHDRCGSCTRCIEACPTACILPDRTIDASRCISYLTIELKGAIPIELRRHINDWLFGCDICQQACPWNQRFAGQVVDPAFKPRPFLRQASLRDFLRLEKGSWRENLRDSPLERPRRKGLLRNAAIVAGNHRDVAWIEDLAHILQKDPDPLPRSHAAWALKQMDHPHAQEIIQAQRAVENDTSVRQELEPD